jgi:hypothetical protein
MPSMLFAVKQASLGVPIRGPDPQQRRLAGGREI